MVSKRVTVVNPQGMHMRPAQLFVAEMTKYDSEVSISFGGRTINAKSIMELMASCIKMGSEIEIHCSGTDETEALAAAVKLLKSGLGDL